MTRRSTGVPRALKEWRSVLLLAAAEEMLALLEKELEPIGLTWHSCRILALIGRLQPVSQIAVVERLGIDRTTMSNAARRLSDLELVYLLPRGWDRRRRELELTAHGEQVLAHAEYAVAQAERAMFGRLGVTRTRRLEQDLLSIAPRQV
jgi:DNA-binding MarR family transcriptional regulator